MPNKNYIKGRALEYKVVKKKLEEGAILAVRTAGSHGPCDVIAVFDDHIELIQCKNQKATKEEWSKISDFASSLTFDVIVYMCEKINHKICFTSIQNLY